MEKINGLLIVDMAEPETLCIYSWIVKGANLGTAHWLTQCALASRHLECSMKFHQ